MSENIIVEQVRHPYHSHNNFLVKHFYRYIDNDKFAELFGHRVDVYDFKHGWQITKMCFSTHRELNYAICAHACAGGPDIVYITRKGLDSYAFTYHLYRVRSMDDLHAFIQKYFK